MPEKRCELVGKDFPPTSPLASPHSTPPMRVCYMLTLYCLLACPTTSTFCVILYSACPTCTLYPTRTQSVPCVLSCVILCLVCPTCTLCVTHIPMDCTHTLIMYRHNVRGGWRTQTWHEQTRTICPSVMNTFRIPPYGVKVNFLFGHFYFLLFIYAPYPS